MKIELWRLRAPTHNQTRLIDCLLRYTQRKISYPDEPDSNPWLYYSPYLLQCLGLYAKLFAPDSNLKNHS